MANGRNKSRKGDAGRDSGGFVALPWSVLDCPAYMRLSHPAKALLFEVARQFHRDDNGRMLLSRAYLAPRGWHSPDVIARAKRDLLTGGFIHETVMGHRPNKASWYAVTWRALDKLPGYDAGAAETFKRGAYQQNTPIKNTSLRPPPVLERAAIEPSPVLERGPSSTSPVSIGAVLRIPSSTSPVHPLEMPSIALQTNAARPVYFSHCVHNKRPFTFIRDTSCKT